MNARPVRRALRLALERGLTNRAIVSRLPFTKERVRAAREVLGVRARPAPGWDHDAAQAELTAGKGHRAAAAAGGTTVRAIAAAIADGRLLAGPGAYVRRLDQAKAQALLDEGRPQKDVALACGVSQSTVSRAIADGRLVRRGGR